MLTWAFWIAVFLAIGAMAIADINRERECKAKGGVMVEIRKRQYECLKLERIDVVGVES